MKTVKIEELAQKVSRDLNSSEADARAVLERAVDMIRKELQRGNGIELENFLSIHVRQGDAVATQTQAGGTLGLPSARIVQIDLDDALRKAIEGAGLYQIMLIVPKRNFFTGVMASRLASARSEVTVVQGIEEAASQMQSIRPDLIVIDVGVDNASRICEAIKKDRESSLTSIIIVGEDGFDPKKVNAFTVLPDEHINEPFDLNDLVKITESELGRTAEERNYFDHVMHFRLKTVEEQIDKANDVVSHALLSSGLPNDASDAFSVGFREAMDNATRHGNKSNEDACIDVQYIVDREKVTITVSDDGEGFDTEIYLSRGVSGSPVDAARERHGSGGHGGLGIMLMLKCVDKLEYNYAGNKISLTRYIRKK
ncbi:MAG: ATP-binding protein [Planctomycetota bacterium]